MFNLILLISFTHASYQYGSTVSQPYNLPYVLSKDRAFCKNHGHQMQGEVAVADALVLQTPPAGGVVACAQSVMFHAQQNMCSDVFWASQNQCACLRPGVVCNEKQSESGFAIYQLTRLGKKHDHHKKCKKLQTQTECEQLQMCEWVSEACGGKVVLSKEHYGYPVAAASPGMMNPALGAAQAAAYPGMAGAPLTNLNTQLVPWKVDYDCDREIDEHTGLSNVIDLPPAQNANQCLQFVRSNPQCNQQQFSFQNRADHYPGGCACIRVNLYCDEESNPGWMIFDFTRGPTAMGGGLAAGSAIPQAHGLPPAAGMPGTFAQTRPGAYQAGYPGAVPGVGAIPGAVGAVQAGYPRTQAGVIPGTQAGYPLAQAGIAHPQAGMAGAHAGAYPGAYPQTGAYQAGMGAYPATGVYPQAGAYQAGMGYGGRLSKSHADMKSSDKSFKMVLLYAVIPVAAGLLVAAAVVFGYRRYLQSKRTDINEHILMEDSPSV